MAHRHPRIYRMSDESSAIINIESIAYLMCLYLLPPVPTMTVVDPLLPMMLYDE